MTARTPVGTTRVHNRASGSHNHSWVGLGVLLSIAFRRDRVRLPLWIIGIVALELLMVTSIIALYPSEQDRAGYAVLIDNPGGTFLIGRIYSAQSYTSGVITGHQTMVMLCAAAASMGISTLIRHSRSKEESGRVELVRAAPVGRHAPLTAAILVTLLAQLALAGAVTVALMILNEESITPDGALLFAAAVAASGLVFTGVAALAMQFFSTSRGASGFSTLLVGASFLVRGASDVADNNLSWASPLGGIPAHLPVGRQRVDTSGAESYQRYGLDNAGSLAQHPPGTGSIPDSQPGRAPLGVPLTGHSVWTGATTQPRKHRGLGSGAVPLRAGLRAGPQGCGSLPGTDARAGGFQSRRGYRWRFVAVRQHRRGSGCIAGEHSRRTSHHADGQG